MIENRFLYFLTYSDFKNKLNAGLINENSIAFIEDLSLIWTHGNEFGNSTPINLNEEDLAIVNDKIQFADKDFDPSVFSGLGRKYLRKNIVSRQGDDSSSDDSGQLSESNDKRSNYSYFINLLDDTMVNTPNTVYVVLYDYDLDGAILAIPENCVLRFDGGSIFNGALIGQNTLVVYGKRKDECFKNVQLLGTWTSNDGPDLPIYAGSSDASLALNAINNVASGANSVAEGSLTTASGMVSHAEGSSTAASGMVAHAEGYDTEASGSYSHAEGYDTASSGAASHAEGWSTKASGSYSHAEGLRGSSVGVASHSEGKSLNASGITTSSSQADVIAARSGSSFGIAYGAGSHNEGNDTVALGDYAHAEGEGTNATGQGSHSEGKSTNPIPEGTIAANLKTKWNATKFSCAWGLNSHVEGKDCLAEGDYSHSEGTSNYAGGNSSHAEGQSTTASNPGAHAEGQNTEASGLQSHAEGLNTTASGIASHAEGNRTIASNHYEHAEGQFNKSNAGTRHSVGIGTSTSGRKNAFEIMFDGKAFFYNLGDYDGTNPTNADSLQTVIATLLAEITNLKEHETKTYYISHDFSGDLPDAFFNYFEGDSAHVIRDSIFMEFFIDLLQGKHPRLIFTAISDYGEMVPQAVFEVEYLYHPIITGSGLYTRTDSIRALFKIPYANTSTIIGGSSSAYNSIYCDLSISGDAVLVSNMTKREIYDYSNNSNT